MAQEAYDFARFETSASAQQATQQVANAAKLRSVKGGKGKQTAWQKVLSNVGQVLLVVVFFATAFALVQSEAKLTEYSQQIQSESTALTVAQSEYNYLQTTLNASINIDQVEKVAKELGLVKLDESQVTYIRLQDEAVLTTAESNTEKWKANIESVVTQLLEYLDP